MFLPSRSKSSALTAVFSTPLAEIAFSGAQVSCCLRRRANSQKPWRNAQKREIRPLGPSRTSCARVQKSPAEPATSQKGRFRSICTLCSVARARTNHGGTRKNRKSGLSGPRGSDAPKCRNPSGTSKIVKKGRLTSTFDQVVKTPAEHRENAKKRRLKPTWVDFRRRGYVRLLRIFWQVVVEHHMGVGHLKRKLL